MGTNVPIIPGGCRGGAFPKTCDDMRRWMLPATARQVQGKRKVMYRSSRVNVQSAALPYRITEGGDMEILLVTTRKSGRWGVPKGRIPHGMSFSSSAAKEAFEEAGVEGEISGMSFASYRATKRAADGRKEVVEVWVYPLHVMRCLDDWPERGQRDLRWCSPDEAIALLGEEAFGEAIRRLRA